MSAKIHCNVLIILCNVGYNAHVNTIINITSKFSLTEKTSSISYCLIGTSEKVILGQFHQL